jgi:hypothetical protein
MGYDLSQWAQGLPPDRAELLFTKKGIAKRKRKNSGSNPQPFPVDWRDPARPDGEYELDTLGSKRLRLRWCERPWRDFWGPRPKSDAQWMYICDAFGYFQCSFLKAINPAKSTHAVVTTEEFDKIREGKQRRESAEFDLTMIEYCALEVEVLSRLMRQLNLGMVEQNIRLPKHKFFGPGQTAQATLDLIGNKLVVNDPDTGKVKKVVEISRKNIETVVPLSFRDAARHSYYGGWFEILKHGTHKGTCYEYDINSAYPKVMTRLPCLLHGRYREGKGNPYHARGMRQRGGYGIGRDQLLCLVEARVYGSHPRIGAMLHRIRSGPHKGSVIRPQQTEGWFWLHELEAAQRAKVVDDIDFMQWLAYTPCDCAPPLRALEELYLKRLEIGKNTPSGVALKLMYNSCYGKFAQSIGAPKYANPIYASLITAGCRCMILDAIATHQRGANAVLMVATDGIYFTEEHRKIMPDPATLGRWERTKRENITLFKPGCYWDQDVRDALGDDDKLSDLKLKARGVNMHALAREIARIDDLFATMKPGDKWPSATIETPFQVVSPTQALARRKWNTCGLVSFNRKVVVSSDPSIKRKARGPGWSKPLPFSLQGLRSLPYDGSFGEELPEGEMMRERPLMDFTHPDGNLITQLAGVFTGRVSEYI